MEQYTLEALEAASYVDLRALSGLSGYPTRLEHLKAITDSLSTDAVRYNDHETDHYWRCARAYLGCREYIEAYGLTLTYSQLVAELEVLLDLSRSDRSICPLDDRHYPTLQAIGWQGLLHGDPVPLRFWRHMVDDALPTYLEDALDHWETASDAIACFPGQQDLYVEWVTKYAKR